MTGSSRGTLIASSPRPAPSRPPARPATPEPPDLDLLLSDLRTAFLLVNEARYRAVEAVFGIPRERRAEANLVTAIALVTFGAALHEKSDKLLHEPGRPDKWDALGGLALVDDLVYDVAGPWSRDIPLFGPLVLLTLAATVVRPALRRVLRSARGAAHGARAAFNHRYGRFVRF